MSPNSTNSPNIPDEPTSRVLLDFILEASESELRQALESSGESFEQLVARSSSVISDILSRARNKPATTATESQAQLDLRKSLWTLLQLVLRREHISEEDAAIRADIPVEELRSLRSDPSFIPRPRTIYQLEHCFGLPSRSLAILSGLVSGCKSSEIQHEAVRFAAHSGSIGQLAKDERALLSAFIAFLKEHAKDIHR